MHYISPNYGSRAGWKPDVIVCHITDGAYAGAVAWLCNKQSQVSSHFVVSRQGEISQLVDIRNEAWCNGTQSSNILGAQYSGRATASLVKSRKVNANLYTISIECEGDSTTHGTLTDAQFSSVMGLIEYIRQQVKIFYGVEIPYDRDHIIGHCEVTPKEKPDCPGKDFPYKQLISELNPPEPITQIDYPKQGGTYSSNILVEGWAVAVGGVKEIGVYYDNNRPLKGICPLSERPDVNKQINAAGRYADALHSGYSYTIPHGALPSGKHTLKIAGVARDSSPACWNMVDIIVK